jgi:hypothetical protein
MKISKPKRTAEQLRALIREQASQHGPWPAKMTMLLYRMNDSWEVMVSPGKTAREEDFRITVLWISTHFSALSLGGQRSDLDKYDLGFGFDRNSLCKLRRIASPHRRRHG